MYYNDVQLRVKNNSQCYKDRNAAKSTDIYTVTATNQNRDPLYKVNYSFGAKSYDVQCACKEGPVANTFPNIDVYNIGTQTVQTIDNKMCSCDTQLYNPASDTMYFSGYPGLVRFMNTASLYTDPSTKQAKSDTTFFDTAINGSG
jgi:hypothetical protein